MNIGILKKARQKSSKKDRNASGGQRFDLAGFIIAKGRRIEAVFVMLCALSLLCIPFINVNYDLTEYLPDSAPSKVGLNLMEEEFGYPGTARIMIDGVSLYEAKQYKNRIEAIDGVDLVMWCDSSTDVYESEDFIDYDEIDDYYKDNAAVMDITFDEKDSAKRTSKAIDEIRELLGDKGLYVGMAVQNKSLAANLAREMKLILTVAVIMIYLILTLTTTSWFEPVLFLLVMGIAILLNKGTNILIGNISFLTDNVVAVLQMAVSMDYSIFLLHAFTRNKAAGQDENQAIMNALDEALSSILASSLTTIVGFIVLMVMKFDIGFDLGLSLAKGVAISLATVLFLMPALILKFSPLIVRTGHRSFLPEFHKLSERIYRVRFGVLVGVALLALPMYAAQSMNQFTYGNSSVGAGEGTQVYDDDQKIVEKFGRSNMMMAIVPNTSPVKERSLAQALDALPYVKSVMSLADMLPQGVPEDFLPESATSLLHTKRYARIMMYTRTKEESETAFRCADEIRSMIEAYYPQDSYLVGATPSTQDIKQVITADYSLVNLLSLAGVFLVVMFTYRSAAVPLVVMIPIEVAIFVNMAVPYLVGERVVFMGYIVVSCIQLGATVDYAILTTGNYIEARKTMDREAAAVFTLERSIPAIFTSGSILTIVGYILYMISSISAIGDLGHLIGRGAWMSVLLVLTLLPALLVLVDPLITYNEIARLKDFRRKRREIKNMLIQRIKNKGKEETSHEDGQDMETDQTEDHR